MFADTKSGHLWNIEVKRLVLEHVREVDAFASSVFSKHLDCVAATGCRLPAAPSPLSLHTNLGS